MIVDLDRFLAAERPYWRRLEQHLDAIEPDPAKRLDLEEIKEIHYLYERVSADLVRVSTSAYEPEVQGYLESLVSRAYGEIHGTRLRSHRFAPLGFLTTTFPATFRRRIRAFGLALLVTLLGAAFGAAAITFDEEAKSVLMPFHHLLGDPSDRVAEEEAAVEDRLEGGKATFSATLATHNTKVSVFCLALGITWGIGTLIVLFHNGVILGAVCLDYLLAGEGLFLAGWLLPHGVVEIPAILIAGQAGLVLAGALLRGRQRAPVRQRLREAGPDIVTLIGGVALLLLWAGLVEAFLSQYHEPVLPYALKIAFGVVELVLLVLYLGRSGRQPT